MKLKELRLEKGTSQTNLAKEIGIPRINYNKYELGENEPNIETMIKIADYYNVSLDYLVGRNYYNEIGYLTESQKSTLKLITKLNEINLLKANAYISGLLANQ